MVKKTLLIIGCGDIALRTVPLLLKQYRLLGLCRNPAKFNNLRLHGILPLSGDLDCPNSLNKLSGTAQVVLHLAPPNNYGTNDNRTKNLLAALTRQFKKKTCSLPQRLVYISTSGVYGDCGGTLFDETQMVNPGTERAMRRVNAEQQIRKWGKRHQIIVSILRVPGIYAANRLPVKRLQDQSPLLVPEDDCFTNHIHADDLARAIYSSLRYGRHGRIYHICDDSRLKMGDYFDLVAKYLGLPVPPRIKLHQAKDAISPNMLSYLNESRQLMNFRMKNELKINLKYPTVFEGINKLDLTHRTS